MQETKAWVKFAAAALRREGDINKAIEQANIMFERMKHRKFDSDKPKTAQSAEERGAKCVNCEKAKNCSDMACRGSDDRPGFVRDAVPGEWPIIDPNTVDVCMRTTTGGTLTFYLETPPTVVLELQQLLRIADAAKARAYAEVERLEKERDEVQATLDRERTAIDAVKVVMANRDEELTRSLAEARTKESHTLAANQRLIDAMSEASKALEAHRDVVNAFCRVRQNGYQKSDLELAWSVLDALPSTPSKACAREP